MSSRAPRPGKPHFLLSARAGWRAAELKGGAGFDEAEQLALVPQPGRGRRLAEASGCAPSLLTDRLGLALAPWGDLLRVDSVRRTVEVRSRHGQALRAVWGPFDWLPWDVAVGAEATVWVSDPEGGLVHRFDRHGREGAPLSLARPERLAFDCEGRLYVSQAGADTVAVFATDGTPLELISITGPLAWETAGRYRSLALDSGLERCPWHRVVLEGTVPAGTRVVVATLTSEVPKSEAELADLPESRWAEGAVAGSLAAGEAWDCLVQSPPGRYLWLRLDLEGDGAATPRLGRVRVELPRRSSLERLPAVYQEDAESRHFLDRWLSNFDTTNHELGLEIGAIARLFDPRATPAGEGGGPDFLSWLAGWLGLTLERALPLARRRLLVANAHRLYRLRGTRAGLELALALALGVRVEILEHHRLRRWLHVGSGRLGDCAELFGPALVARLQLGVTSEVGRFQLLDTGDPATDPFAELAHRFTVYVPAGTRAPAALVRRLVELAKPAHTEATVEILEPRSVVGGGLRVGLTSVVGRYPQGVHAGANRLGRDTVLTAGPAEASPPTFRLGSRSRIGATTRID